MGSWMESTDKKLGIVVSVVILIIIASIVLFPYPSEAEKMVINSNDLGGYGSQGTHWQSWSKRVAAFHDENYTSSVFVQLDLQSPGNQSLMVWVQLWVFGSRNDSIDYFMRNYYVQDLQHGGSIGDISVSWYGNESSYERSHLYFIEDTVCVMIQVWQWQNGVKISNDVMTSASNLANIQIEKIDQYLAQHPEAN
jgi:hypothetical protein